MKTITIHRVSVQFDADQVTHGDKNRQAEQAILLINSVLQYYPTNLGARIIAHRDEIEVRHEDDWDDED